MAVMRSMPMKKSLCTGRSRHKLAPAYFHVTPLHLATLRFNRISCSTGQCASNGRIDASCEISADRQKRQRCVSLECRHPACLREEPLLVQPSRDLDGHYDLLDGRLRLEALKQLGHKSARCMVSLDDEGFTFNRRITRIAAVQAHRMIRAALAKGASKERIAQVLNIDVKRVREKVICSMASHPKLQGC
jgi:hypothetical protein